MIGLSPFRKAEYGLSRMIKPSGYNRIDMNTAPISKTMPKTTSPAEAFSPSGAESARFPTSYCLMA